MKQTVEFKGGPRDGKTGKYSRNPKIVACASEWLAAGMNRGLYKWNGQGQGSSERPFKFDWVEV